MRMTLGIKNNNPFNIRYNPLNKWKGLTGNNKGFCTFQNMEYGLRAGIITLKNYVQKHKLHSVEEIISRYAPSSENPTSNYISYIRSSLAARGLDPDYIEYNRRNFLVMCQFILLFESFYNISEEGLLSIIKQFKIR